MNNKHQWRLLVAGSAAALVLSFGVAVVNPQVSQAQDTTTPAPAQVERNRQGSNADREALLADALGITTEDLQAAYKAAASAAIDQAVKDELLTEDQATTLRERLDTADVNALGRFGFGHKDHFGASNIDAETLLAGALGITVADLESAQLEAEKAALDQAVTDGNLTQEQADLMLAQRAFRTYQEGQRKTIKEEIDKALTAGAITQAQADLLLNNLESAPLFEERGFGPGMDGAQQGAPGAARGMDGRRGHDHGSDQDMPFDNNGSQIDPGTEQPDFGAPQSNESGSNS